MLVKCCKPAIKCREIVQGQGALAGRPEHFHWHQQSRDPLEQISPCMGRGTFEQGRKGQRQGVGRLGLKWGWEWWHWHKLYPNFLGLICLQLIICEYNMDSNTLHRPQSSKSHPDSEPAMIAAMLIAQHGYKSHQIQDMLDPHVASFVPQSWNSPFCVKFTSTCSPLPCGFQAPFFLLLKISASGMAEGYSQGQGR